jgi:hypothetical protein
VAGPMTGFARSPESISTVVRISFGRSETSPSVIMDSGLADFARAPE